MVHLSRIYTRSGDDGNTMLGDGSVVAKDDPRIAAIGAIDELNAAVGLVLAGDSTLAERPLLERITNELFDVGADLCCPIAADEQPGQRLRVDVTYVARLESEIDRLNAVLPALGSFVLPGGTPTAAGIFFARAVCRRAECGIIALGKCAAVNPALLAYLNRLSDLLFVLGRAVNRAAGHEPLWQPGKSVS
jgi:cob(I)alamin adenosyltransferase